MSSSCSHLRSRASSRRVSKSSSDSLGRRTKAASISPPSAATAALGTGPTLPSVISPWPRMSESRFFQRAAAFLAICRAPRRSPSRTRTPRSTSKPSFPFGQRPGDTEESSVVSILERGRRAKKSRGRGRRSSRNTRASGPGPRSHDAQNRRGLDDSPCQLQVEIVERRLRPDTLLIAERPASPSVSPDDRRSHPA
jgi:hypothetical protein